MSSGVLGKVMQKMWRWMWPNSKLAAGIVCLVLAGTPKTSAQEAETNAKPTPPIAETVWTTAKICDSINEGG